MNLSEILNHLGEERSQYFNAISPPIIQSSNFAFDSIAAMRRAFEDELANNIYTRGNNPTTEILRKKLAALEKTEDALVFGSGAAAIAAAVIGNVKAGDHIVCVKSPYTWTFRLLTLLLARFDVTHTFVDGRDVENFKNAIQPNTKIIYLESPNSLFFDIQDLRAVSALAKAHNIITIIDNSHCSPIYQRPAEMGIDVIVHSGTKYLNGHSDVVIGALCSSKEMVKKIFISELMTLGSILAPQDAMLVIRGLRTLPLRMERSHESALKIAKWLELQPKVSRVLHPFLPSFPQHELAMQQMSGNGGLFTVQFKTDSIEKMEAFCDHLKYFSMAVSWGGHESLIMPTVGFL